MSIGLRHERQGSDFQAEVSGYLTDGISELRGLKPSNLQNDASTDNTGDTASYKLCGQRNNDILRMAHVSHNERECMS